MYNNVYVQTHLPMKFVVCDINSHNDALWDYVEGDRDIEKIVDWSIANELSLVHDPKLPVYFQSARGGEKDTIQI